MTASGRHERVEIDEILTNGAFEYTGKCFLRHDMFGFKAHYCAVEGVVMVMVTLVSLSIM